MTFKERLIGGAPLLGTFQKTPAPVITEILALSDLDCVCLDAEHAPFDRGAIDLCVMAARAGGMPVLVRSPTSAPEHILAALDSGANGVVLPHIRSVDEARAAANAAHYGRGGRGYAGTTRSAGFAGRSIADHLERSAASTIVIAQIEDIEAVDVVEAIAAVDGIDALFVGRIDLTVALGATSPVDAAVVAMVERIVAAGRNSGRAVGMFVSDMAEIPHWRAAGANLFLLGSDHGFLLSGAKEMRAATGLERR